MTSPTDPDAGRALSIAQSGEPHLNIRKAALPALPDELYFAGQIVRDASQAYALAACAERDSEIERWNGLWDNVAQDVPNLRSDNRPLAIAASWELLKQRTEAAEARVRELEAKADSLSQIPGGDNTIYRRLRDADARGVAPPQNWTTAAADEMLRLHRIAEALRARLDSAQKQEPVAQLTDERVMALWEEAARAEAQASHYGTGRDHKRLCICMFARSIEAACAAPPLLTDSAVFWHGIYPEGGAEMTQEMHRLREVIAGLRAQIEAIEK